MSEAFVFDAIRTPRGRGKSSGSLHEVKPVKLLATLHPAFLLRQPVQKRLAWRDFRSLRALLDGKA